MRSYLDQLAENLNGMQNPSLIGVQIGEVVALNPITVRMCDGLVEITEGEEAVVCEKLKARDYVVDIEGDITISQVDGALTQAVTGTCSDGGSVSGSLTGSTGGSIGGHFTGTGLSEHVYSNLSVGDSVLCVPQEKEQSWIIVDKVV